MKDLNVSINHQTKRNVKTSKHENEKNLSEKVLVGTPCIINPSINHISIFQFVDKEL